MVFEVTRARTICDDMAMLCGPVSGLSASTEWSHFEVVDPSAEVGMIAQIGWKVPIGTRLRIIGLAEDSVLGTASIGWEVETVGFNKSGFSVVRNPKDGSQIDTNWFISQVIEVAKTEKVAFVNTKTKGAWLGLAGTINQALKDQEKRVEPTVVSFGVEKTRTVTISPGGPVLMTTDASARCVAVRATRGGGLVFGFEGMLDGLRQRTSTKGMGFELSYEKAVTMMPSFQDYFEHIMGSTYEDACATVGVIDYPRVVDAEPTEIPPPAVDETVHPLWGLFG